MGKLSTNNTKQTKPLNPIHIKVKGEIRTGTIFMMEEDSKIEIGHTIGIGLEGHHTEETCSFGKSLGEEILEVEMEETFRKNDRFNRSRSKPKNRQFSGNFGRDQMSKSR